MGEYHPPTGSLDVAIPRTPTRIVIQTCILHFCADFAYTHLCELLPRFRSNSFNTRCLQVLLFWHMPEYLLLQQFTTLLAVLVEESGVTTPLGLIQFGSLAGWRRLKSRAHRQEVDRMPWTRGLILAVAMVGCWWGSRAYVERFGISYHQMSDVGNLGIDHRNGWVSILGLMAGGMAVSVRLYIWSQQYLTGDTHTADAESGAVAQQRLEKDEDTYDFDTCRVGLFDMKLDDAVMLVEAFSAAVIHQIPLIATHRTTSMIAFLPATLVLLAILVVLALKQSKPAVARKATVGLKLIPMLVIAWTILEPSFHDLNELYDASATIVHQWTFRWQVTDCFDRLFRPLI